MKTILAMIGAGAAMMGALLTTPGLASAATTVIYKQDFENGPGERDVAGSLVGQDGWVDYVNGTPIQVGVATGGAMGGNLGQLDDMQILPTTFGQPAQNYANRPLPSALDPTKVYTLTFDADNFDGGFGFGGAINGVSNQGTYLAAVAFDIRIWLLTRALCSTAPIPTIINSFRSPPAIPAILAASVPVSRSFSTVRPARSAPITTTAMATSLSAARMSARPNRLHQLFVVLQHRHGQQPGHGHR